MKHETYTQAGRLRVTEQVARYAPVVRMLLGSDCNSQISEIYATSDPWGTFLDSLDISWCENKQDSLSYFF